MDDKYMRSEFHDLLHAQLDAVYHNVQEAQTMFPKGAWQRYQLGCLKAHITLAKRCLGDKKRFGEVE